MSGNILSLGGGLLQPSVALPDFCRSTLESPYSNEHLDGCDQVPSFEFRSLCSGWLWHLPTSLDANRFLPSLPYFSGCRDDQYQEFSDGLEAPEFGEPLLQPIVPVLDILLPNYPLPIMYPDAQTPDLY